MSWAFESGVLGRVLLAAVLGLVIGFERERDGHPAGTRTFGAVAIGAALFGVISTTGFEEFFTTRARTNVQVDVTRVASQVVVGIGFLGAGVIFRQGGRVQNLTTAATLWAVAAVGLAAGVGEATVAVAVTVLIALIVAALPYPLAWALRVGTRPAQLVRCTLATGATPDELRQILRADGRLHGHDWKTEKDQGRVVVIFTVRARGAEVEHAIETLATADLVHTLQVVGAA